MTDITVTIIGGGIVGCATAAAVADLGVSTVLLEKETRLGAGTTSRNSEVVHGGMYYPTGSRKARCCVRGRRLLRDFCRTAGVGFRECGKLIVAVGQDEEPDLHRLLELGRANDVENLRLVGGRELKEMLPEVKAIAALHSPRTAIIDAEGAARAYAVLATERGAQIMTDARVSGLERTGDGWQVTVTDSLDGRRTGWRHTSQVVINAAGLYAAQVAAAAGMDIDANGWQPCLVKGNYFAIDARHTGRIDKLVYPVPPADGSSLGVHVCVDLAGGLRLGPDVEVLTDVGAVTGGVLADGRGALRDVLREGLLYAVDVRRQETFYRDASRFLPWLEETDLRPDYSGIRPKLAVTGFKDFVVEAAEGDQAGLVNLIGIDSPGLTSAAALAEDVVELVRDMLA